MTDRMKTFARCPYTLKERNAVDMVSSVVSRIFNRTRSTQARQNRKCRLKDQDAGIAITAALTKTTTRYEDKLQRAESSTCRIAENLGQERISSRDQLQKNFRQRDLVNRAHSRLLTQLGEQTYFTYFSGVSSETSILFSPGCRFLALRKEFNHTVRLTVK